MGEGLQFHVCLCLTLLPAVDTGFVLSPHAVPGARRWQKVNPNPLFSGRLT